ncbi:CIS tube protein [Cardinium endosymbiont of Oedothorax gibbosus]|uniref:CIS tube protein n=1 Tax=Cardinium endosymbiont of Oedothorax gibbosus TaxID=931101 RepID=UPI0020243A40|nr:hypothetical protein [Cardinium endosymbiont of Oedothorax gibbosus]CAH2559988.1 Afp7-like phage contractile injection system tube protein [Cardinium endosymbiont of Oedothorax gibbosus]
MSNVSKLVIKACSDNKFASFTGEFITSINPENLVIKSAVSYHVPEGIPSSSLLKYRGSPPKLLSFSLLFDNTGIIPGSNTIAVMEQVKQLQNVAYSIHKKNNAPNYIRVIWGQIDFKGRLVALDIVYSMFQVDGTLVRAEAHISVLEELVPLGKGKSAAGVDGKYAKASGANATSNQKVPSGQGPPVQEVFGPTPNGMSGAYSGAPPGAYDGGPDQIYQGSNGAGGAVYSSGVGASPSGRTSSIAANRSGDGAYGTNVGASPSDSGLQGGVAGNGPGGSGGGVGGGGHRLGSSSSSGGRGPGSGPSGSRKSSVSPRPGGGAAGSPKSSASVGLGSGRAEKNSLFGMGSIGAAGVAGSAVAAAAAGGANSLRKLKANANLMQKMEQKMRFWRRLKNFAKKVSPKGYEAGKKLVKSNGF